MARGVSRGAAGDNKHMPCVLRDTSNGSDSAKATHATAKPSVDVPEPSAQEPAPKDQPPRTPQPRRSSKADARSPQAGAAAAALPQAGATPLPAPAFFPRTAGPLPREVLVSVLTMLTAADLGPVSVLSRAAASPEGASAVASAVAWLVKHRYGSANPSLTEDDTSWERSMETLRFAELRHVAALLQLSEPRPGKGYYLSKTWASNFRRYTEAASRRRRSSPGSGGGGGPSSSSSSSSSSNGKSSSSSKGRRGRERAESNVMPPWSDANADVVCPHGGLARAAGQAPRGKRTAITKHAWRGLRVFFPLSTPFPVAAGECGECTDRVEDERRAQEAVRQSREQEIATPTLRALFGRKTGVPPAAAKPPPDALGSGGGGGGGGGEGGDCVNPLRPGIYHLMPRCWLTAWRGFVRDPKAAAPRPLETSVLLCEGHGRLLPPPHVVEYLCGQRRHLLGSLDPDRSGCVCEILLPEEWDALTLLHPCDYGVRFCVHPEGGEVVWSTAACRECDPCHRGEVYVTGHSRKLTF